MKKELRYDICRLCGDNTGASGGRKDDGEILYRTVFNPSSIYPEAKAVASRLEECREQIARYMKAEAEEIIFTSGGTESDNLAIKGVMLHPSNEKKHMVTSVTEHHAVLESCRFLEKNGI